jgi:hypothetical protein
VLDHVAQQIGVGALLDKVGECDSRLGHRGASSVLAQVW